MKLEVEAISKEIIKPSCPTPNHLRQYELSFLDQVSPMVYNPSIMFYSLDEIADEFKSNITAISNHLKKSLSDVLTHYYPVAGRVNAAESFVDCNDEGVPFIETKVKCNMSEVIQNPVPSELNHLVPFQLDDVTDISLGVQLNVFECGGVAIGVCLSHHIADGLSFFTFLKSWAGIASGEGVVPNPQLVSSKLFPPRNTSGYDQRNGIVKENVACKVFVFDAAAIEALRERYAKAPSLQNEVRPTRVEALSAFIWERYVAVTRDESSDGVDQRLFVVIHAVNLRPKMDPPLPLDSFGNYYRITMTIMPPLDPGEEGHELVTQVRDQIKKIDKDYVRNLQEGSDHLELLMDSSCRVLVKGELVPFSFTSLCRFPVYDTDFGWGKPTWVSAPALTFQNLVVFRDAKTGGAIEAYLHLSGQDMAKLEADKDFVARIIKPSVI